MRSRRGFGLAAPGLVLGLLLGCAGPPGVPIAPDDLHRMPIRSISGEEVWEGEVVVDRIVVVRAGGHLVIRPGTRVLFRRVDWDGDGIGDAELTAEGRLTARGTPQAPILFASAEADPRPADWKYVMVNFSPGAELAYARVSHAFSGLQVHYSPARVERCEFTRNVDGVRFSTARLEVEGCWIHGNTHGVRFEERGHPARLVGNEISDNEVGVFAVTQSRGGTLIQGNNLRNNATAVKLGWEQPHDLAFPGNHWGPAQEAAVLSRVLDGRADPGLGRVSLAPLLPSPAPVEVPPFSAPPDWPSP
ncbi:MAG: right-handed parallel beta-helix repeat-containing protein [Thermodesulfobacteriota bacterium]